MELLQIVLFLLLCAVALGWVARHFNFPYPIALVIGGGALSFVPNLPHFPFDPQFILVLVLPPILYQAALLTSWRDFKANIRPIGLLAIGLVIVTTLAVGAALNMLIPECPWGAAFVLGAIVSPPDAVAATAQLPISGASNNLLFTATSTGSASNGWTIALVNSDVAAVTVQANGGTKVLTIQARLSDSPNGVAHTAAQIAAAVTSVAFTAAVTTDSGWQPMLDSVRISACMPAPPVGSVAEKTSTIGGVSDIQRAANRLKSDFNVFPSPNPESCDHL